MSFDIRTTPRFERSAKALFKRYRSLKTDIGELIAALENNPFQGDELTPGIRKIRMAITSKGRGKSGGARVITYTIVVSENEGRVYLIDIYDKSDYSTVELSTIIKVVADIEPAK
ncbi:MAG: addiction module toxin RelE [Bacteroidales bacterium]|nr:addiction module toxin RelE [Bacteroidales bacterium]